MGGLEYKDGSRGPVPRCRHAKGSKGISMKKGHTVRSACGQCYAGCGIIVHVKDGRAVKVEGDPESKTVTVQWNAPASREKIRSALQEINYPAA